MHQKVFKSFFFLGYEKSTTDLLVCAIISVVLKDAPKVKKSQEIHI